MKKDMRFEHKVLGVDLKVHTKINKDTVTVSLKAGSEDILTASGELERVVSYGIRQLLSDSIAGKAKKEHGREAVLEALRENFPQRLRGNSSDNIGQRTRILNQISKLLKEGRVEEAQELAKQL